MKMNVYLTMTGTLLALSLITGNSAFRKPKASRARWQGRKPSSLRGPAPQKRLVVISTLVSVMHWQICAEHFDRAQIVTRGGKLPLRHAACDSATGSKAVKSTSEANCGTVWHFGQILLP